MGKNKKNKHQGQGKTYTNKVMSKEDYRKMKVDKRKGKKNKN